MTAPSVGGSAVPATLASYATYGGGRYKLSELEERQAADGSLFRAGVQAVEWTWAAMGSVEYAWWRTQWGRGSAMAFELWTDDTRGSAVSFTSGRLWQPQHEYVEAGLYRNVVIRITHLLPVLT